MLGLFKTSICQDPFQKFDWYSKNLQLYILNTNLDITQKKNYYKSSKPRFKIYPIQTRVPYTVRRLDILF